MRDKNATECIVADTAGISRAAKILRSGGLVAVPTETVYGLAARADSDAAVARIYTAKGRPSGNPLIVHVGSLDQAKALAEFPGFAEEVAKAAWPGALTLVLPKRTGSEVSAAVTTGLKTIAIRMPDHPVMQAVLLECRMPLAAPSANRSNAVSPTSAEHVLATLDGRLNLVLDGGSSEKGLESTILAIRHDGSWEELRPGPVDCDLLHRHFFDRPLPRSGSFVDGSQKVEAPGQFAKHYSPGKPVRLEALDTTASEYWIGFGVVAGDISLSPSGDLAEAAANLYSALHTAAQSEKPAIALAPIPSEGIGNAINDRLRRAAA